MTVKLDRSNYRLRPMAMSDMDLVLMWRNSERIRKVMYTDHLICINEHKAWFNRVLKDNTVDYQVLEYDHKPIGLANLAQIDRVNNNCYWGFYIGEEVRPPKSGFVGEFMILEYAFNKVGIRKLLGEVFSFNEKILTMHKQFGFVEEGRLMKHAVKNNEYHDVIIIALFSEQWKIIRPQLESDFFNP